MNPVLKLTLERAVGQYKMMALTSAIFFGVNVMITKKIEKKQKQLEQKSGDS